MQINSEEIVKKKVLMVQDKFGQLSEVFLYRIIKGINKMDVDVLSGENSNPDLFPYKHIYVWDQKVNVFIQTILFLRRKLFNHTGSFSAVTRNVIHKINSSDADLVCFQFSFLPVKMGKDINEINKKICIFHHGTDVNKAIEDKDYHQRLKLIWERADQIIFASRFLMHVANDLGCPMEKALVHYLGVPVFSKIKTCKHNTTFRFICVARLVSVKNHLNIIRAFAKVIDITTNSVELVLIGSGELYEAIEKEISCLGLDNYIKLLGAMSNEHTIAEISKSDCILLISKIHSVKGKVNQQEGLGISLLEGASLGLSMIGSNTGGIPEVVINNVNGYLVEPLDIEDIKEAMLKVVDNPEMNEIMGQNARSLIYERFNINKQIQILENILMNI